ncbi:hypothetical protein ACI796_15420 [Geodermatophilus sp. SYSU D00525]
MAGRTRRRRAPLGARLAVTAGVGAAAVLATPGMASAHYGSVSVTCVTPVQDGYWNVVFGYTNTTGTTATVQRGQYNDVSPDRFDGAAHPVHPGSAPRRVLGAGARVREQRALAGPRHDGHGRPGLRHPVPSSTPLPADGNGMGIVIALAAAGAVGGTSVVVSRRRRDRGTPEPVAG